MRRRGRAEGVAEGLPFDFYVTKKGSVFGSLKLLGRRFLPVDSYFSTTLRDRSRFRFLAQEMALKALKVSSEKWSCSSGPEIHFFSHTRSFRFFQERAFVFPGSERRFDVLPPVGSDRAVLVLPPMTRFTPFGYVFPTLVETTQQVLVLQGAASLTTALRSASASFRGVTIDRLSQSELVQLDRLLEEGAA